MLLLQICLLVKINQIALRCKPKHNAAFSSSVSELLLVSEAFVLCIIVGISELGGVGISFIPNYIISSKVYLLQCMNPSSLLDQCLL